MNVDSKVELREIPGFPGYKAGVDGNIYSFKRHRDPKNPNMIKPPIILKACIRPTGRYLFVGLMKDGKAYTSDVHRLICITFNGYPLTSQEASHLNGDRFDNRPSNLIWENRSNNLRRRIEHGTDDCGIKNSRALFNGTQIKYIRERILAGVKLCNIATQMGCNERTIGKIKRGEHYARN